MAMGGVSDESGRVYIAIDLKSFYASVECAARHLDPLTTHLVVADETRTDKTICLAVSPSLKAYGIPGRDRLFAVKQRLAQVNAERMLKAPGHRFVGESWDATELARHPEFKASMIIAMPRMARYLQVSADIYAIYLEYAAPEHIHVYSVDEVFIDATPYLRSSGRTPHEMARTIVAEILERTGITATAGIGTNLYLAKIAMDIVAKHMPADADGVRVAELDEASYRRLLWGHRPLTDFWRVGRGYARKLEKAGLMTMGDIARCSIGRASDYYNEELLYRMFGVNAELLIDHAWGWEPCTIADIKAYEPDTHSTSIGQVLTGPADHATALLIVKEMADALALDLTGKGMATNRIALAVGYDSGSLDPNRLDDGVEPRLRRLAERASTDYRGPCSIDRYGRRVPKPVSGEIGLGEYTASAERIRRSMTALFRRIVDPGLLVRRLTVIAVDLATPVDLAAGKRYEQLDLFSDVDGDGSASVGLVGSIGNFTERAGGDSCESGDSGTADGTPTLRPERADRIEDMQRAMLAIKHRYGRNAVVKAMDMEPGATGIERNKQIGGHRANGFD
ncbi:type VI secretion protein ImpB [Bifidobacterium callitrichos]|uniref:Type VI secretion protein ImpB n=2 Tax=Bifidobacterium callitrichos TaxID=762209 RepID=A0A5M9ZF18_9BIFI|nr:type VI secretion protein ImpB [Bifidobacterium callitrichos]KAA8817563.1 type VI secretion protein ImpB [Bifidobacterium callitrichos]KFI56433.1 DNA methylase [Bifidobacterium callitrichos DSM 23973]